jgi:gluconate 5-dehydrogenase
MGTAELFSLKDKIAIVTGGGRGLGLAMAEALSEAGGKVVICSRKEKTCKEAAQKIVEQGGYGLGLKCDVSRPEDILMVRDIVLRELGRIDILVNNSGATWGAPTEEYPIEGWNKVIGVNVTGTFLCSKIFGGVMKDRGGGKIVNVSSITGSVGCKPEMMDAIAYNTSKGAIDAFTKDLAVKWAKYHIYVNAIAPAFIETDLTRVTMNKSGKLILDHVPMGRFGQASDLKGAVVFLCSKASDYITGTVLYVDGGYTAV